MGRDEPDNAALDLRNDCDGMTMFIEARESGLGFPWSGGIAQLTKEVSNDLAVTRTS